jgi:hypothetical protein
LNRILGRDTAAKIQPDHFQVSMAEISDFVNAKFGHLEWPGICSQNLQNCLCEFDKYERVRLGEGRPKQLYRPPETATDAGQGKLL